MARGGRRVGRQGVGYGQRTDLNASVQRTAPPAVSAAPAPVAPAQAPSAQADPQQQPYIRPDQIPSLTDPTQRPGEPVTAGLNVGPGEGAPPFAQMGTDETGIILRMLYGATGSEDIRRLLAAHERGV